MPNTKKVRDYMKQIAYLVLKRKSEEIRSFKLSKSLTTLGRNPVSDITLFDPRVSFDHAKIVMLHDGSYEVCDIGASNPIWVNESVISHHKLQEGDEIRLGDTILIFQFLMESDNFSPICQVEFLGDDADSEKECEIATLDAKKTVLVPVAEIKPKDLLTFQRDHQRLMLLYEVGKIINSQLDDFRQLLEEIMTVAFKMLDAQRGFIALVDERGEPICETIRNEEIGGEQKKLEVSRTMVHRVLSNGISILTNNAISDSEFRDVVSVVEYRIRSAMCSPLLSQGDIIGVIYLDNRAKEGSFSEDDLVFLTALGQQAGIAIRNARLHREIVQENIRFKEVLRSKQLMVGNCEKMKTIYKTIRKVAPSNVTLLITGETGTGKELVAKTIHELSPRSNKSFVDINCAAISSGLVESELFGHEKGAFTGAIALKIGKFELAQGGTIFLDEIGAMSLSAQAKVLRVLQEREFERVGGVKKIRVDVRVIAATSSNLQEAIRKGDFREDLYFRLNVVNLELPPLRERRGDIIPLAEHFAQHVVPGKVCEISPEAKKLLLDYDWPGNVRVLRNYIERAIVLGDSPVIYPEDLPYCLREKGIAIPAPLAPLEQVEKDHIIRVLRYTRWHKVNAIKILGVSRQTLDNKIEKYHITDEDR